jgi:hypothetical protein
MKFSACVVSVFLAISATSVFAAERVAFSGNECGGGNGVSTAIYNGELSCPVALPYSWGVRTITKVRVDVKPGESTSCGVYVTNAAGTQIGWKGVNYNAGDVVVNLTVPANNYVHLRCRNSTNIPPQGGAATMRVNGYIVESN